MGIGSGKIDDCNERTVESAQYMIHNCILYNPKNKMHFKVMNINYDNDDCEIECIEVFSKYTVRLSWIKNWIII